MLFGETCAADVDLESDPDERRNQMAKLRASAASAKVKVRSKVHFGQRSRSTGRIGASSFHRFPRLNFCGVERLPIPSLQRLKRCSRSPCFTSHSPKSRK